MEENNTSEESTAPEYKLYSLQAMTISTGFFGPLAGTYMLAENYKNLGNKQARNKTYIVGLGFTILLFVGIFSIPEHIIDAVPRFIIPAVYAGLFYGIGKWLQERNLEKHKHENGVFYSGWRAFGVGCIAIIVMMAGAFIGIFFSVDLEAYSEYDKRMAKFSVNEDASLVFYDIIETATDSAAYYELEYRSIPLWEENIEIVKNTRRMENFPSDLVFENDLLLKYSKMRLEVFKLYKKAIQEQNQEPDPKIDSLYNEMEDVLEVLNAM